MNSDWESKILYMSWYLKQYNEVLELLNLALPAFRFSVFAKSVICTTVINS